MAFLRQNHFVLPIFLFLTILSSCETQCRKLQEDTLLLQRFEQWMAKYGKVYKEAEEKQRRFKIFKNNLEFIESYNAKANDKSYKLGVNQFADLSKEEIKASVSGNKIGFQGVRRSKAGTSSFRYENVTDVPDAMDWRTIGAVTPVKAQSSHCGSCWAFAAVAATEALFFNKLVSLSEQQIIDCDGNDSGCKGGHVESGYEFIMKNGGITSEANYPYRAAEGTCNTNMEAVVQIKGYEKIPPNNEEAILKAVAHQPVAVTLNSGGNFPFYKSGIFSGPCEETYNNHAATIVGYGTTNDYGIKYWILKNSWGTAWGEGGYMRMQRDEGICGMALDPSYPLD